MIVVKRKRVVVLEMEEFDYTMLLDTLGQAAKVRSKLFPLLNETAKAFVNLLQEEPIIKLSSVTEKYEEL